MKHTQGKWTFDNVDEFIYSEDGTIIADPHCSKIDLEERIANAKLIAAAPELLRSLEFAVRFIKNCPKLSEEDKPRGLEKWEEIIENVAK